MSETVKLIIELPKDYYEIIKHDVEHHLTDYRPFEIIGNGIPLDDVKAEITEHHDIHLGELKSRSNIGILMFGSDAYDRGIKHAIEILDNIGKESEETHDY